MPFTVPCGLLIFGKFEEVQKDEKRFLVRLAVTQTHKKTLGVKKRENLSLLSLSISKRYPQPQPAKQNATSLPGQGAAGIPPLFSPALYGEPHQHRLKTASNL